MTCPPQVIVRLLTAGLQRAIRLSPRSFLLPDGRIDVRRIFSEFAEFWDANGEILAAEEGYHETAAQLIFMAYLQRVVNGGGYVDREYGAGTGRIDRHHLESGYLMIFDRRPEKVRDRRIAEISEVTSPAGRSVALLRV